MRQYEYLGEMIDMLLRAIKIYSQGILAYTWKDKERVEESIS